MCYTIDMARKRKSNAPGLSFRKGLSTMELLELVPDDATAEQLIEQIFWGRTGRHCGHCGATDTIRMKSTVPSKKYHCRTCRNYFTVETNSFVHGTHIPLRKWVYGIYLMVTHLRGTPSMKVYRDLKITQKTAWYMIH